MPLSKPNQIQDLGTDVATRAAHRYGFPNAADTVYWRGHLACFDPATGAVVPASDSAGLICIGRIEENVDATGLAQGSGTVAVRTRQTFKVKNDPANPLAAADMLAVCYVLDSQTVSKDPGAAAITAGRFIKLDDADSSLAWVEINFDIANPIAGGSVASAGGDTSADNYHISGGELKLWNQDQAKYQKIGLAGAAGAEQLIIEA